MDAQRLHALADRMHSQCLRLYEAEYAITGGVQAARAAVDALPQKTHAMVLAACRILIRQLEDARKAVTP